VASQLTTGAFSMYFDDQLIADRVKVPNTGGWNIFTNITVYNLPLTEGIHVLRIYSYGGFNLGKMTFQESTSTRNISGQSAIRLYPNPASKLIWVELPAQQMPAYGKVFSIDGKLCEVYCIGSSRQALDISGLPAGYYYLNVELQGDKTTLPFIVR
jgi:hypothetical protein